MNIAFWNIRGVGKKNLWEELSFIRKNNSLNILALSETKCNKEPFAASIYKAGFDELTFIPSTGLRGGLWILWKHN